MNLEPFTGPGSTPSRRRFWDQVTKEVIASQKIAGRFVTVDEHPGKGTVINVDDTSARRGGGGGGGVGACCYDDGTCDVTTEADCDGVWYSGEDCESIDCSSGACCHTDGACTQEIEADCDGAFQGLGTLCDDIDCTHTGACCDGEDCSITREDDCTGAYQGDGTTCDPNPCCGDCGFITDCGSCHWLTENYSITQTGTGDRDGEDCHFEASYTRTQTTSFTSDPCEEGDPMCTGGSWSITASGDDCGCSSGNDSCVAGPSTECAWDVLFGGATTVDTTDCTETSVHRHREGVSASPITGTWVIDEYWDYS